MRWFLSPLALIAIPFGFIYGFFRGIIAGWPPRRVVPEDKTTLDTKELDELLKARHRQPPTKKWEELTDAERAQRWEAMKLRRRRRELGPMNPRGKIRGWNR
jgi:hypothetical protein